MRNDDERENCKGAFQSPGTACGIAGEGEDAFGAFPYVRAIRQLGRQENVVVLDLFQRSLELLELYLVILV